MNQWTITDFLGNTVHVDAIDLADALDTAYDDHRVTLYGNAEHWDIVSSDGTHYPRESDYDWDLNPYDYDESLRRS